MADPVADSLGKILHILQGGRKPTHAQSHALVVAMSQILREMGPGTIKLDVCLLTKARARIAFDPWIGANDRDIMSLDDARQIVAVCEG